MPLQRLGGATAGVALAFALLLAVGVDAAGAEGKGAHDDVQLANATSRCMRAAELLACYEALHLKPNSPELLMAEADALVQAKRPGEAIGVYRNALTVGANRGAVDAKIAVAAAARRPLLGYCESQGGQAAEHACEAAWLPGAPDEVTIFKRRAQLLQQENHATAALDAYMAAARLRPQDRAVARSIVGLVAVTGRKDAPVLAALAKARDQLRRAERRPADRAPAQHANLMAATPDERPAPPAAPTHFSNDADDTRSN